MVLFKDRVKFLQAGNNTSSSSKVKDLTLCKNETEFQKIYFLSFRVLNFAKLYSKVQKPLSKNKTKSKKGGNCTSYRL